jgi:hypothetical protein
MALQQKMPKAQVWVVVKVVTFCLNRIVSTFVMNQSRGHWLLLDALTIVITLIVNMEATLPLFGGLGILTHLKVRSLFCI